VGATRCVLAKVARDNQSLPRTFAIKELLLRRVLFVNRAELEAEGLRVVLGTGYSNYGRVCHVFTLGGFRCDNGVFAQFVFQQRPYAGDDSNTHYRSIRRVGGAEVMNNAVVSRQKDSEPV
jgi:hypothetical protein